MRNTFLTDFKFRVASFAKYAYSCGIKIPVGKCDSCTRMFKMNQPLFSTDAYSQGPRIT